MQEHGRYLARKIKQFKEIYPGPRYHISRGDTEQVTEKLEKGVIDFAVLTGKPDTAKYHALAFPEADVWGLVLPAEYPLTKKSILVKEAIRLPLF